MQTCTQLHRLGFVSDHDCINSQMIYKKTNLVWHLRPNQLVYTHVLVPLPRGRNPMSCSARVSFSFPSSPLIYLQSHTCRFLPPPFSSPRAPRIMLEPSKKPCPALRFGDQHSIKIWLRLGSRLRPKKWPTWAQLGSQDGAQDGQKSRNNRFKNRSKNRCLLGSIFGTILVDFWKENGGKLAPKKGQKRT